MSSEAFIPPLRELPARRLAERAEHLRGELHRSHPPRPRRRSIAIALVVLALGVLLATPAFGLRDQLGHLFGSDTHPPEVIRRYFTNQSVHGSQADPADVILAKQARVATAIFVDGYGKRVIWVAPTKAGGFCTTGGLCDRKREIPFLSTLEISGPDTHTPPNPDRDVHVFLQGTTLIHGAKGVAVTFEDGTIQWLQLQWVPKPIDAGFYLYELPKEHWDVGRRPLALVVEDATGKVLARDAKAARYFRDSQRHGFAAPSNAKLTPPPPPPAPKKQTFDDPADDAPGSALDVTHVTVTERDNDTLDFEVTLAGELNWDEDGPLVAIDTDRNPDTGSAFYGTEFQLALVGGGNAREAEPVLYRANGWDFRGERFARAAWGGGPHSSVISIKRSVLGLKPGQGFNLVAGSVSNHPDMAPDFGTFSYEPSSGTPPPPLGRDRRAPKLFAYDSMGVSGGEAKLHYWVLEGRGSARQVIRIFRGRRLLKTIWTPLAAVNPFGTTETGWRVPPDVHGALRYRIRSFDAAGNASTLETAALLVR
jgi:hypothetical protein